MPQSKVKEEDVRDLIYGKYSMKDILKAVNDDEWQEFRKKLKKLPTDQKIEKLREWRNYRGETEQTKMQITNYVNALKRGGKIVK